MSEESSTTEVVSPTDISLMKTADELKVGVRSVLAEYEKSRVRADGVRRLDDIWDQVWQVEDTNRNVLMMMNQCFVLFQDAYDRFFASLTEDEAYLKRLQKEWDDTPIDSKKYKDKTKHLKNERERIEEKAQSQQKNLRGFMDSATKMAHEYRQCRTSAAFFFHISQLQQFLALQTAILHQNITDAGLLKKVSGAIESASLKLFPQERGQDG